MPVGLVDILAAGVTDDDGAPLALGTVTFYLAGTSTLETVYQDFAATTPHANPLTLDDAGRAVAYSDTRVKAVIRAASGAAIRTVDNINLADSDVSASSATSLAGDGLTAPGDGTIAVAVDTTNLAITADTVTLANRPAVTSVTAATYATLAADELIAANATSNAITVNLIAAASYRKKTLRIRKTDNSSNAVTIDGNASETIGGLTTITLKSQGCWIEIYSDGSNWQVLGYYNWARSTSSSTYTTTSGTLADVTNLSVTIDVLAGPVKCQLEHDQGATRGGIAVVASASGGSPESYFKFLRGSTNIGFPKLLATNSTNALNHLTSIPASAFSASDSGVTAGSTTYKFQAAASETTQVYYAVLRVETWL